MSFSTTIQTRLRDAVTASLPCQAAPVQMALGALLSAHYQPLYTLTACSFDDGEACLHVGAALDLVHIALQRLHARVDTPDGTLALLGKAGNVLAGDYLTSGSFKLLLHCSDMRVLQQVADAITRSCELECEALGQPPSSTTAMPLGAVAAWAGATLAGHGDAGQALARRFGTALFAALGEAPDAAAQGETALALARELEQLDGNARPRELAEAQLAAHAAAQAPAG